MLALYERIKARREELGLTQEELAHKLGYKSRSSINKVEKGENDIPQSKIAAFARALDTTPEYLMGWVDEPTPEREAARIKNQLKNDDLFAKQVGFIQGFMFKRDIASDLAAMKIAAESSQHPDASKAALLLELSAKACKDADLGEYDPNER